MLATLILLAGLAMDDEGRAPPVVDVFVIAGQSNATGQGVIERLPADLRTTAGVRLFHTDALKPGTREDRWHALRACGEDEHRFGPELGFARRLVELRPGRSVALIKHAVSGSSLRRDWLPGRQEGGGEGRGRQLRKLDSAVRTALRQLSQQGMRPVLRALLWQQGEAEARGDAPEEFAEDYDLWMGRLLTSVREEWGAPELALVYGDVLPRPVERMGWRAEVREAQRRLEQGSGSLRAMRGALRVRTDDLSLRGEEAGTRHPDDLVHFGTEGSWELGRRMAERWVRESSRGDSRDGFVELLAGDATGWRAARGTIEVGAERSMVLEGQPLAVARTTSLYENVVLEWEFRLSDPAARHWLVVGSDRRSAPGARLPDGDSVLLEPMEARPWPAWNRARVIVQDLDIRVALNEGEPIRLSRRQRRAGCLCFVTDRGRSELRGVRVLSSPGSTIPDWRAAASWGGESWMPSAEEIAHAEGWRRDGDRLSTEGSAGALPLMPPASDFFLRFDYRWAGEPSTRRWPLLNADGSRRVDERGRAREITAADAGEFRVSISGLEGRWLQFWSHPAGSGAVRGADGSLVLPEQSGDIPPGTWNRCELRVRGRRLELRVGGRAVLASDLLDAIATPRRVEITSDRGVLELTNLRWRTTTQ